MSNISTLDPNIRGAVAARVTYLMGQWRAFGLEAKINEEVFVQSQSSTLSVDVHSQEEGAISVEEGGGG